MFSIPTDPETIGQILYEFLEAPMITSLRLTFAVFAVCCQCLVGIFGLKCQC